MPGTEPPLPVLLLSFNRPEHVRLQVSRLEASPIELRLYVAIDGPRPQRQDDTEAIAECLRLLKASSLFSDQRALLRQANLGCGRAVSEGISWFFSQEVSGVILEDDCIPLDGFWAFARESLDAFESHPTVGHISGSNFVPEGFISNHGARARLSRYPNVWGWATWRDRWSGYQLRYQGSPVLPGLGHLPPLERSYWKWAFKEAYSGTIDTWDYQWIAYNWLKGRRSLATNVNLVSNIGWQAGAHSNGHNSPPMVASLRNANSGCLPLCDSAEIDVLADSWEVKNRFGVSAFSAARRFARRFAPPLVTQQLRLRGGVSSWE